LKFVSFVSLVALVSLRAFVPHKHRAQQALYYRILYHDFTLVTSEADYRVERGGDMVFKAGVNGEARVLDRLISITMSLDSLRSGKL
jgi:hypothetical protein